jgi:hypothetical protein
MSDDPAVTDAQLYQVVFENERVRVLEYRDKPGDQTRAHRHPDSVMFTLSGFRRRVSVDGRHADVELGPGQVRWIGAQQHIGTNTGDTDTHVIFVELKEPAPTSSEPVLGPSR